jgi:hypothetical protein
MRMNTKSGSYRLRFEVCLWVESFNAAGIELCAFHDVAILKEIK